VDDRGDTDNFLGTGIGEQLYDGRVYSCFACYRNYCGVDQGYSRKKNIAVIRTILVEDPAF